MSTDKIFRHYWMITQQIDKIDHQIDQQHQLLQQHQQAVDTLSNNLTYLWRQKRMLIEQLQTVGTSDDRRNGMHTVETLRI